MPVRLVMDCRQYMVTNLISKSSLTSLVLQVYKAPVTYWPAQNCFYWSKQCLTCPNSALYMSDLPFTGYYQYGRLLPIKLRPLRINFVRNLASTLFFDRTIVKILQFIWMTSPSLVIINKGDNCLDTFLTERQ